MHTQRRVWMWISYIGFLILRFVNKNQKTVCLNKSLFLEHGLWITVRKIGCLPKSERSMRINSVLCNILLFSCTFWERLIFFYETILQYSGYYLSLKKHIKIFWKYNLQYDTNTCINRMLITENKLIQNRYI